MQHRIWQKAQQWICLVLALTCWFFAMGFWVASTETEDVVVLIEQKNAETQQQVQPVKVTATSDLGMLTKQVPPLKVSERFLTTTEHEAEFRGTKFMTENAKKWTIELFRVSNENVIKGYLTTRADRNNYYYFRLTRAQQPDSFVLVYGVFDSENMATSALSTFTTNGFLHFKPQVTQFSLFAPFVNDLGSDEVKSKLQLHAVKLTAVALPPTVELLNSVPSQSALAEQPVATQTTVVQRDLKGNVIHVEQSKSRVLEPNLKPDTATNPSANENNMPQPNSVALPNGNN